ncbi:heavy metal translocating P-type ATPase [Fuchsiella alkaliacetigena]|uniref:heavy metal translocating P-type ATPase n=1 Tax=Fuchsiella alkaliacetigena TaxID=957042 RepID=UPI00200A431B|nr:heavy metal translocating P-type ATPase [Fuchsiella alkaliacetigena]MCK8823885.1 cadmium-translocating P-type ATPase [Fuchsiella alkaliacetigena]
MEKADSLDILRKSFILKDLDCASCAQKIENRINNLTEVRNANLNFATKKLTIDIVEVDKGLRKQLEKIINSLEPGVEVIAVDETSKQSELQVDTSSKIKQLKLISGALLFGINLILSLPFAFELGLFLLAYILIGGEIVLKALNNITKGQIFDENFLMTIATTGAFLIGEFPEGVAVMLFYKVGEGLQNAAVDSSRRSIAQLMDLRSDYANLEVGTSLKQVDPKQVEVGAVIVVKAGEKIPLDGKVLSGEAAIDSSALTGESVSRRVEAGDEVLSGSINQNGFLRVRVEKEFKDSTANKILELVEQASANKAPVEKFITKFARYYTPIVVGIALLVATVPPLFLNAFWQDWIYKALVFLVISCPCALVISIPLAFFGGIGGASRQGILVKGGNYLTALNEVKQVIFDKTGTLTVGSFEVIEVITKDHRSSKELLELAAHAELNSNHPIATSILESYSGPLDKNRIKNYNEVPGQGIKAQIDEQKVLVGNDELLSQAGVEFEKYLGSNTVLNIAVEEKHSGYIIINDKLKEDSKLTVNQLKKYGVKDIVMLTGDRKQVAHQVATELGIYNYQAELLPGEKVKKVEEIIANSSAKTLFVGDGINDAPVLARVDVGVAMGDLGSAAAIEAADIVLMTDQPAKLITALRVAKFTRKIVFQNIILSLGIKALVLILGVLGIATLWGAVFADVGVAVIAVLNSMRIIRID